MLHQFRLVRNDILYIFLSLLTPLPWFIFSFLHTRNPVYPFFTHTYPVTSSFALLNPLKFLADIWGILTHADDPISPIYIAFLPLILASFSKMSKKLQYIGYYSLLALFIWYLTPRTGGGRFILPYLPAFSILCVWCIGYYQKTMLQKILIASIIFTAIISIVYRGFTNVKYIPVIFGKETKAHFLSTHLNFSFGDFYDTDAYFAKHIKPSDKVLLIDFHNLYYVNFPFIESSSLKSSDTFNYIATQQAPLPKQFTQWEKIYENKVTGVVLYKKK